MASATFPEILEKAGMIVGFCQYVYASFFEVSHSQAVRVVT